MEANTPKGDLVNLALRRSLFYPAAEIYAGSPSGFWEFGPIGQKIRLKIVDLWRKELVEKEGFLEISGAQILPEAVFRASGHLASFSDPVVQCKKCSSLHRADQLVAEKINEIVPESMGVEELAKLIKRHAVECPKCGGKDFTEVRKFNMMMKVDIGATGQQPCYLRPETCQSIFLDFQRMFKTMRVSLPLGIAQAGTSFRNEIAPRNTILRAREFGQMEIEVFFNPAKINDVPKFPEVEDYILNLQALKDKAPKPMPCGEAVEKKVISAKLIAYCLARAQQCWHAFGIPTKKMRFRQLADDEKAFYSRESWDFEVETELGWIELIACNYRADYDLGGHAKESKQDLKVKEPDGKEEFTPHVFELSAGIDRTLFVALSLALKTEKRGPEERTVMALPPRIAPYLAGVFPLMKKDGMLEKALEIEKELSSFGLEVFFDEAGSIGKRYARIDEIGTSFAITVDYDTMKDGTVTLRERDSMGQKRVKIAQLPELLWKILNGKAEFKKI